MIMAEKRMFTNKIVESDAFLELPFSTRCLYYALNMNADDDGFLNSPNKIIRIVGASEKDLNALIANRFVLDFGDGVICIKHWRMHNTLRKDRYKPTQYQEQFAMLEIQEDESYTEKKGAGYRFVTKAEPSHNHTEPERNHSIDKISIDQISLDKEREEKNSKPIRHKYGEYGNVLLSDTDLEKLKNEFPDDWSNRIENLSSYIASTGKSYKNHLATIRNWARKEPPKISQQPPRKTSGQTSGNPFLDLAIDENLF